MDIHTLHNVHNSEMALIFLGLHSYTLTMKTQSLIIWVNTYFTYEQMVIGL